MHPMSTSFLTDYDLYLLREGTHLRAWERLGAHLRSVDGVAGTHFAVWAPSAREVSAIGDWNGWGHGVDPLSPTGDSGIWQGFVPGVGQGAELVQDRFAADGRSVRQTREHAERRLDAFRNPPIQLDQACCAGKRQG